MAWIINTHDISSYVVFLKIFQFVPFLRIIKWMESYFALWLTEIYFDGVKVQTNLKPMNNYLRLAFL